MIIKVDTREKDGHLNKTNPPCVGYFSRPFHLEVLQSHPLLGPRQLLLLPVDQEAFVEERSLAQAFRLRVNNLGKN